ncbi:MAG: NAD(P)H-hydrate dehydratase [Verrucomicrobiaceae bacterium]|nr:MAG: NAD(P)H-hydrate dehydratase [Verrucomicrobiaceae bacterium]
MILSRRQMIEAEQSAFARGSDPATLMESAGKQMADFVVQNHPSPGRCIAYAGKGHNGGDVLVAARHLEAAGWVVETVLPESALAPLTASRLEMLGEPRRSGNNFPLVILDGLLGIGAAGNPREPVASAIREINNLRQTHSAWVVAADIPSGLDADSGIPGDPCVYADATVAMGFAKPGLVADSAVDSVGRLAVADLKEIPTPDIFGGPFVLTPDVLRVLAPPRVFDTHKGMAGRVAVIAGSPGYTGAARLCSQAAVLGGAGLVTLCVKPDVYPLLAPAVIPEVMVRPVDSYDEVLSDRWDSIAIGPGLSTVHSAEITNVVRRAACPCVVDADALNVVAGDPSVLDHCTGPRLLTPHPGEMERLSHCNGRSRLDWMTDFVKEHPVALLLKGARTVIGQEGYPAAYNTTGHPGMASGGMGDVLTGVCAALIAQGRSPYDAAMLGAWICGRAAEIAIARGASQESLCASDVSLHLGAAFHSLRAGGM